MDETALKKYGVMLKELESTLRAEIEKTVDDSAPLAVDGRMGRISRGDAMQVQQMALEMKRRRDIRLQQIRTALQRIEQDTYGLCARCRNPIGAARLEAFPDAINCVNCA